MKTNNDVELAEPSKLKHMTICEQDKLRPTCASVQSNQSFQTGQTQTSLHSHSTGICEQTGPATSFQSDQTFLTGIHVCEWEKLYLSIFSYCPDKPAHPSNLISFPIGICKQDKLTPACTSNGSDQSFLLAYVNEIKSDQPGHPSGHQIRFFSVLLMIL